MRWLLWCLGLLAAGIAVLTVPSRFEGAVLVAISPGHGLTVLDVVGLVPLLAGTGLLLGGLWRRRGRLGAALAGRPLLTPARRSWPGSGWACCWPRCSPSSGGGRSRPGCSRRT